MQKKVVDALMTNILNIKVMVMKVKHSQWKNIIKNLNDIMNNKNKDNLK